MQIDRIKISKEVNISGMHYWIGLEASILEHENEIEALIKLDGKIDQFCNPVIQTAPKITEFYTAPPEELPVIDVSKM